MGRFYYLFTILLLCSARPAGAINSLLNYAPSVSDFPAEVAHLVAKATAVGSDSVVAELRQACGSVARGLSDEAYFLLGWALESRKVNDQALEAYNESLKRRSSNPLAIFRKGLLLKEKNQCREALPLFDEVAWSLPEFQHESQFVKAECLLATGKREKAIEILEASRKRRPDFIPAAKLLVKLKMEDLASPTARKRENSAQIEGQILNELNLITKGSPDDRETAILLSRMLVRRSDPLVRGGDLLKAENIARPFAEKSGFKDEEAVRLLFDAQFKRGDLKAAEQTITRGLAANPKSTKLLEGARQLESQKDS